MAKSFVLRTSLFTALAIAVLSVGPFVSTAQAQDDKVYALADLQTPPKLKSSTAAGKLIADSYPEDLRSRGVGGMVEVEFVVGEDGKVVPGTVNVLDATQTQLGEAAKKVAAKLEFNPGKAAGAAVKCKVVLPIVYKAR
jgi:protein TonB